DILNSQPDSGFGDNGIVDDIIRPYSTRFFLKGHPVLVDLNTDGKLEIAVSAFYDDPTSREMYTDWFTELFVYNSTGGKMFSVCETSPSGTCNDGSSETNKWEGTNPFVLDSNKDGFNEICFIKDKKERYYFKSMAINCYNYSGNVILDAELFPATDTVKTATVADMNSDGIMEVITPDGIYDLEGNLVFLYDLDFNFVIPADIDKNNALDLLWAKENQTIVFLDNFSYSYDLAVEEKDIFFQKNNTRITVHNLGNGFIENAEILLLNPNTMENATFFASIRGNGNLTINSNISLSENEQLLVQIDYGNKIEEADEKNNFASKTFEGFPYVFVSAEFEINNLEEEFRDFIKDKLSSGYYTGKEDEASVKVYIGKNNWFNKMKNAFTRFNYGYYYDFGAIYCKDSTAAYPYNGLIGAYKENDIVYILIYGNEIDGDIAAVKEFINHEADFLTIDDEYSFFVGNDNLAAVKVFDFLHNTGNGENYKKDNDAFRQIVRNALRGEMFVDKTYTVETSNNIILQLKNFKPNASSMYLLYLNSSSYDAFMPVVMAGGIWSNISSWAELGGELANNGRDVWLIEITGGHYTECDECINYNYIDLVDDFWPALIAAVEEYTGNNKIQYVAHSNGCRTALDSLTNWSSTGKNNVGTITKDGNTVTISLSADPIDTFVGVACPGNFSELSYFTEKVKNKGAKAIDNFKNKNKNHLNFRDLKEEILDIPFIGGREQISLNLFKQYVEWINLTTDEQPGKNLFIDYFTLIYGTDGLFFAGDNDFIVPITDEVSIYNQINSSNKYLQSVHTWHIGMTKNDKVKNTVKDSLDKSLFPS
ncbi:alpha/beta hydrolase, partial [Candidatus Woesearchaeota archaeon]|nr:alpha/beta hydrolase [Candidatus Woesearchaeota archaeon]